jgi:hypothetical protein
MFDSAGSRVYFIFLKDWFTQKEASIQYRKIMHILKPSSSDIQGTVSKYFSKLKDVEYLDKKFMKIRNISERERESGKKSPYNPKKWHFRSNFNPFFDYAKEREKEFTKKEETLLRCIFNNEFFREYSVELLDLMGNEVTIQQFIDRMIEEIIFFAIIMKNAEDVKEINQFIRKELGKDTEYDIILNELANKYEIQKEEYSKFLFYCLILSNIDELYKKLFSLLNLTLWRKTLLKLLEDRLTDIMPYFDIWNPELFLKRYEE